MGKKQKIERQVISELKINRIPLTQTIKTSWIKIILIVVVLVMYGNSINYEFTIDDNLFYVKHNSVQKGIEGIPETFTHGSLEKYNGMTGLQPYRPITLSSFAIQKQLFNTDPAKAHLVNVLLYIFLIVVMFNLLLKIFPAVNPIFCGLIALLFAVHPVHTEVVVSVKSQDELLSVLFTLLALSFATSLIKADKFSIKFSILSVLCYSFALFSKEGAFAMILIFPLAFWILLSQSVKRSILYSIPFLMAALVFLLARHAVLDGQIQNYQNGILENILIGANGFAELSATKMEILFHYLRLFFIPWPLSWDYSYNQIPIVNWYSLTVWLSLLFYAVLFIFAVLKIKKLPEIAFGILFYLIMLVPYSNLVFISGSTFAERFLFFPSLGLIIAVVYGLAHILKFNPATFSGSTQFKWITGIVIVLFIGISINRSNDWKSNLSIYSAGVSSAPNSSRTNGNLGNEYYKLGQKEMKPQIKKEHFLNALKYSKASIAILPTNKDALFTIGLAYTGLGDRAKAYESFQKTIDLYPNHRSSLTNIGTMFFEEKKYDSAFVYFKRSYDSDTSFSKSSQNIAIYYFTIGNYNQAIHFAKNAIRLFKYQLISYDVLSKTFKALGNEKEALNYQNLYNQISFEASELNLVIE